MLNTMVTDALCDLNVISSFALLCGRTGPHSSSESHETSSRKESLLTQAPVVPFDKDLMHWGEPNKPPEPAVMQ